MKREIRKDNKRPSQTLGVFISEKRLEAGLSQQLDLAKKVGVSQQTVSRWEAGTSRPRPKQLLSLAAAIRVDVSELEELAGYVRHASGQVEASCDEPYPIEALTPDKFERFVLYFLAKLYPEAQVNRAGDRGHIQEGLDIGVAFPDGKYFTFQCKRVQSFGPQKVLAAIAAHTKNADRKHLVLSRPASPQARDAIRDYYDWELWDKEDISLKIREHLTNAEQQWLIDIFFPGQRMALLGEPEPSAWQSHDTFFAPFSREGSAFNHAWHLYGRQDELAKVSAGLSNDRVKVIILSGAGGIGKSKLLKHVVENYRDKNPGVQILYASTTDEISAKDAESAFSKQSLLVIDDAHDRNDLEQILSIAVRGNVKLLVGIRPYGLEKFKNIAAKYALSEEELDEIKLESLSEQSAQDLAHAALREYDGDDKLAEKLAKLTKDCPLALVVGAQIVAQAKTEPLLLQNEASFRRTVFGRFQDIVAGSLGTAEEAGSIKKVLNIIALLQPVYEEEPSLYTILEKIEGVTRAVVGRCISVLKSAGVLTQRGRRQRIVPDLLADFIIEQVCLKPDGPSSGYAEAVFDEAEGQTLSNLLVNIGRMDWRLSNGDPAESQLLDLIWRKIEPVREYADPFTAAVSDVAIYQPKRALDYVAKVFRKDPQARDLPTVVKNAAYNFSYLKDACELLWEMGKSDERATNSHPNHAIRLLCELGAFEIDKPVCFNKKVLEFAIELCHDEANWKFHAKPIDVLLSAMNTDARRCYSSGPEITFETHQLAFEVISPIRQEAISTILSLIPHANPVIATSAAEALETILRPPMNCPPGLRNYWEAEFIETLKSLEQQLVQNEIHPLVWLHVMSAIGWHMKYSETESKEVARRIVEARPTDLRAETFYGLVGGGRYYDPFEDGSWKEREAQLEERLTKVSTDIFAKYNQTQTFYEYIEECLTELSLYQGKRHSTAGGLLGKLFERSIDFCQEIIERSLVSVDALSEYTGMALRTILTDNLERGLAVAKRLIETGDSKAMLGVAHALSWLPPGQEMAAEAIELVRILASTKDKALTHHLINCGRVIERSDLNVAVSILVELQYGPEANAAVDEMCAVLVANKSENFDKLSDESIDAILNCLSQLDSFEGYWIETFLAHVSERFPEKILNLILPRIDEALGRENWQLKPCSFDPYQHVHLKFRESGKFEMVFRRFVEWLQQDTDRKVDSFLISQCFEGLFFPLDELLLEILKEEFRAARPDEFENLVILLRQAPTKFVIEHVHFAFEILDMADQYGCLEFASQLLYGTTVSGMRSSVLGEPCSLDVELKEASSKILQGLGRLSPQRQMYEWVFENAKQNIERSYGEREMWED